MGLMHSRDTVDLKSKADAVKSAVDPRAFLGQRYGLEFDKRGRSRCPRHERHNNGDATPSFTVDEQGRCHCWSQKCFGEKPTDIFDVVAEMEGVVFAEAVGIVGGDHDGRRAVVPTGASQRPPVEYLYADRTGEEVLLVKRYDSGDGTKTFAQFTPDGSGGWKRGTDGLRTPLYRLPELIDGDDPVVVVEGEKCVEAVRAIGVTATTNVGGAEKWRHDHADALGGRDVIVWGDNDEPGRRHADAVCRSLVGKAMKVRCVKPPDYLPDKGDVVDLLQMRGPKEAKELIENAAEWAPPEGGNGDGPANPLRVGLVMAADVEPKRVEWALDPYIPMRFLTMIYGDGDVRKSWLAMAIAAGITRGGKVTPYDAQEQGAGDVIYFSGEDDVEYSLVQKATGCEADLKRLHLRYGAFGWDPEYVDFVEQLVKEIRPLLVVFDPVVAFEAGTDTNEANKVRAGLERLGAVAKRQNCAVLLVHHVGKNHSRGIDQLHLGSVDYRNAARSTLVVGRTDQEDETASSVFAHRKHNLSSKRGQSVEFTTEEPWKFRWVGVSDLDVAELYDSIRQTRQERQVQDDAGDFLRELLTEGPMSVEDIMAAAEAAGLTDKQMRTARERLCKKPKRVGGLGEDGCWQWELRDGA